jgi:hypothetical protein
MYEQAGDPPFPAWGEPSDDVHRLEERLDTVIQRGSRIGPTPSWLRLGAADRPMPLEPGEAARLKRLLGRIRGENP